MNHKPKFSGAWRRIKNKKNPRVYPNYSVEWIKLLENIPINLQSLDFLHSLLQSFETKVKSPFPMTYLPPPHELSDCSSQTFSNNKVSSFVNASQNIFDLLVDDESDNEIDKEQLGNQTSVAKDAPVVLPAAPELKFQSRYLRVMIIILIGDCIRPDSIPHSRPTSHSEYLEIQQSWIAVYAFFQVQQTELSDWFEIYQDNQDNYEHIEKARLFLKNNHHDKYQFHYVLHNFVVSLHTTKKKKDDAIQALKKTAEYLQKKLNPMLRDRNEVKHNIGEKKWKNNPHPKGDYAEKRRALEEEIALIQQTVEILSSLQFTMPSSPTTDDLMSIT